MAFYTSLFGKYIFQLHVAKFLFISFRVTFHSVSFTRRIKVGKQLSIIACLLYACILHKQLAHTRISHFQLRFLSRSLSHYTLQWTLADLNSLVSMATKRVQISEFVRISDIIHLEWKWLQFRFNYLMHTKMNMNILGVWISARVQISGIQISEGLLYYVYQTLMKD